MRNLKQGRYTGIATYIRSGTVLDLQAGDKVSLISHGFHGLENQQWEFRPSGAGFVISSVWTGSFLEVRDKGQGTAEVSMGGFPAFPTCWELEAMDYRNAEDGAEHEHRDVYVRIRIPHSEMVLSFKEDHAGAPLLLANGRDDNNTYWRLSPLARQQVGTTMPISTTTTTTNTMTPMTVTTTTTISRIVDDDF